MVKNHGGTAPFPRVLDLGVLCTVALWGLFASLWAAGAIIDGRGWRVAAPGLALAAAWFTCAVLVWRRGRFSCPAGFVGVALAAAGTLGLVVGGHPWRPSLVPSAVLLWLVTEWARGRFGHGRSQGPHADARCV